MSDAFTIAVVGSGPGGLSAACHAAELGLSHVLLEASPQLSNTIFRYQKGKHVMAEPGILPLRSPLPFQADTREAVLGSWDEAVARTQCNVRYKAEVTAIEQADGKFNLKLASGDTVQAERVVLGIGCQGNLRKLGVPGEDLDYVQYQLDDPDEYHNETIVVVGAGDAAIENAIALADHNTVYIVNRRDEFSRAKDGNNAAILRAIDRGDLECLYNSSPESVTERDDATEHKKRMTMVLNSKEGQIQLPVDRVIARLGAIPPRRFVESCGIKFPSDDPASVPAVSSKYESNVPGLYIVGALAGYPLIKQAINQGYEVVEFMLGNDVKPADEPLLEEKFREIPGMVSVDQVLEAIQKRVAVLAPLTTLQLREVLLDSEIRKLKSGDTVYERNDYTNTFYSVLSGDIEVHVDERHPERNRHLTDGQFFGEMSLISGRRREATAVAAKESLLIETPRRTMNKLINSVDAIRDIIDQSFLRHAVARNLAQSAPEEMLGEVIESASLCRFKAGEIIAKEGDAADCVHLIRSGSVVITQEASGAKQTMAYVPAGRYVGEMALLSGSERNHTIRAAVACETIRIDGQAFLNLLQKHPKTRAQVESVYASRVAQNVVMEQNPEHGKMIGFLMREGIGEATDALLIDESLCLRCDYCEKACAATHGNVSRLNREAGATFANVHVPTSCRHCEHPHCMSDCPPDAIHRAQNGEVFIDDSCIGCGNCVNNCPYGVIQLGVQSEKGPSLWQWLLFGRGVEPGTDLARANAASGESKKAVKCDMCKDRDAGPACVQACPTGAAIRVSPEEFIKVLTDNSAKAAT